MNTLWMRAGSIAVLCHLMLLGGTLSAQTDSSKSIVFTAQKASEESKPKDAKLGGIASINLGPYSGFHDQGQYSSFIQPNIGFEFLAEPTESFHLLLGGRIGFLKTVTTGISFGLREPIAVPKPDLKLFADLGILFFDDAAFVGPLKYGVRLAFGARTIGSVDFEYRLAGEWRGMASDSVDGYRNRVLWWLGAEVGIAFSLVGESKPRTRKDSLHASLRYIASGEEMEELDAITSDTKLDQWLDRFWRIRDVTPDTKINEARIEFEKRVETANRLFSRPKQMGVLTDPGRVMLIYGLPDIEEKDRSLYDSRIEYMLWVYSGRVRDVSFATFIFSSTDQRNTWEQVYSNVPGELTGSPPAGLPVRMSKWVQY